MKLTVLFLTILGLTACGSANTSQLNDDNQPSLMERVEALEKRMGLCLAKHKDQWERIDFMSTELNRIEIDHTLIDDSLNKKLLQLEELIEKNFEGFERLAQGNGVSLNDRIKHSESALLEMVAEWSRTRVSLKSRLDIITKKLADLGVNLNNKIVTLDKRVEHIETKIREVKEKQDV